MFDINKDFEVTSFDGMHDCKNRIMCDYLAKVTINQNGKVYFGEVGYVGRNLMDTKPKYLFIENKVHNLGECDLFNIHDRSDFEKWLFF